MSSACTSAQAAAKPVSLFLLAHNDDEFFVRPRIVQEILSDRRVICVYTTDGAAYGEPPERRLKESIAALGELGLSPDCIVALGAELQVRDGSSHREIQRLWEGLLRVTGGEQISSIFTLAWDGGHVDHDTAHLLAVALGKVHGCGVAEFPAYHRHRSVGPFFRCMSLLPGPGPITRDRLSFKDALQWAASCRHFRSQRRTFLGLLPFCLPQILGHRTLETRLVPPGRDYLQRPHDGPLLYESRFKVPHPEFLAATQAFVEEMARVAEEPQ